MSLQPDNCPSSEDSSYRGRVFRLGEDIERLRTRAEELGMFAGSMVYTATIGSSEELRIIGGPIYLRDVVTEKPLLYLAINKYFKPRFQNDESHQVFTEEFVIDERSMSVKPYFISFKPTDLESRREGQPPVLWMNEKDEWYCFRGSQTYTVPDLPTEAESMVILDSIEAQAGYVATVLQGFTPGCEDGRLESGWK
jgi:hypothetical protein